MRLSLLFVVIISSCTAQRGDQAAGYFKTKGITTSAIRRKSDCRRRRKQLVEGR